MVIIFHIHHYPLIYCILGSECYHPFTLSYFNDRFKLCNSYFFIKSKPSRSCMSAQYQSGSRMFVILDCTECHAYISYIFTWVWRHLPIFHIFRHRTVYHQFHSSIFMSIVFVIHISIHT